MAVNLFRYFATDDVKFRVVGSRMTRYAELRFSHGAIARVRLGPKYGVSERRTLVSFLQARTGREIPVESSVARLV